jgi:hypothetical protein
MVGQRPPLLWAQEVGSALAAAALWSGQCTTWAGTQRQKSSFQKMQVDSSGQHAHEGVTGVGLVGGQLATAGRHPQLGLGEAVGRAASSEATPCL